MSSAAPFEVIPLGAGNFFSTKRFCTSMVLCAGGKMVLVDCPDPFFRMCHQASVKSGRKIDPGKIDHLILTHLHGDHCNGLEPFAFWKKFHLRQKVCAQVHTSREVAELMWRKLSPAMGVAYMPTFGIDSSYRLADYFDVRPFQFGASFTVCGIKVETRRTLHSVPCFGFRASYKGRRFGYSCDTSFDPELIKFLEPCDLIFHECDKGFHTPLEKLEALPAAIRRKMRLIHLNDEHPGSSKIRAAQEGKIYAV